MALGGTIPRLPEPPKIWSPGWMQDFIRTLTHWMQHLTAEHAGELVVSVTTDTNVGVSEILTFVDTSAGEVRVVLPPPAVSMGKAYTVKRIDAGNSNAWVSADGGSVERAAAMCLFSRLASVTLASDGAEYWLIASVTGNARVISPGTGSLSLGGAQPVMNRIVPGTGSLTVSGNAVSRSP